LVLEVCPGDLVDCKAEPLIWSYVELIDGTDVADVLEEEASDEDWELELSSE
jgi:hypothetical protein